MCGELCKTIKVEVEIQENGIIRDVEGKIIGRLIDGLADFSSVIRTMVKNANIPSDLKSVLDK